MARRPTSQSGFSLAEMMVAIAVLGIALAVALPNFHGTLDRARADRVEQELRSDLRLAMSTAKATGRTVQIRFADHGYRVVEAADTTRVVRRREFDTRLRLEASGNPLVFPWGLVQPADLRVDHRGGSAALVILPTGRLEDDAG